MNNKYKIHRWDGVLFGNSVDPTPIIYVKPDENLLQFAKDNHDALLVKLNVPDSIYDGKLIVGQWFKSSEIPNCRSEFFKNTDLYIIVLIAPWHGYPNTNGTVTIFGTEGGVPVAKFETQTSSIKGIDNLPVLSNKKIERDLPKVNEQLREPKGVLKNNVISDSIPLSAIIGILVAIIVLVLLIIIIST